MNRAIFLIAVLFSIVVAGCSPQDFIRNMMTRMVPEEDTAFAQEYLGAVRSHDIDTAIQWLDPELNQAGAESNLTVVADILDHGEPVSTELVGCNTYSTSDRRRSMLTYQYQFTNAWILAHIVVDTTAGEKLITGITVSPIPHSLGEMNAFTFEGKGIRHYSMLICAVFVSMLTLCSLVICIRTKMKKRKWLWILFILLGVGQLTINWTTGSMYFYTNRFQILGAGVFRLGLYGQWTLTVSFPLGALLFLLRRKKLMKAPERDTADGQ